MTRVAVLLAFLFSCAAGAQEYPSKPIRVVVPISAGSATDIIARLVADGLRERLGQSVVVENRPGAGGTIGAASVAKAPADGYTLLIHSNAHVVNAALYKALPYDPIADFVGITNLVTMPNVLVVSPSKGVRTVAELVALGKSSKDKLMFGSGGQGSSAHMNAEHFRTAAGFEAVHVAFRGTPEAMADTIAGRVDFSFLPVAPLVSALREGRLLPVAVASPQRSALLPDVPTTVEAGVANSSYNVWIGMLAPAGTPRQIVALLNKEVVGGLRSAQTTQRLAALGAEPAESRSDDFDAAIRRDLEQMRALVSAARIPVN